MLYRREVFNYPERHNLSEDWEMIEPHRIEISVNPSPLGIALKQASHLNIRINESGTSYRNKSGQGMGSGSGHINIEIANRFEGNYSGLYVTGPSNTKFGDAGLSIIESEKISYFLQIEKQP